MQFVKAGKYFSNALPPCLRLQIPPTWVLPASLESLIMHFNGISGQVGVACIGRAIYMECPKTLERAATCRLHLRVRSPVLPVMHGGGASCSALAWPAAGFGQLDNPHLAC